MCRILDAKYEKANINTVVKKNIQNLNAAERHRLLNLLMKPKYMFNGTLGTWNTTPADLGLKYDAEPVCLKPYAVPMVKETILRKDVKRLVSLGVTKEVNDSEWGATSFAKPQEKTDCIRLLSEFQNLNRQLKRNPHPTTCQKYVKFY